MSERENEHQPEIQETPELSDEALEDVSGGVKSLPGGCIEPIITLPVQPTPDYPVLIDPDFEANI